MGKNEWLGGIHWSPDGQRLAYIRAQGSPERSKFETSIETSDLKGANRTVVVSDREHRVEDSCWLPDGRIVYSQEESLRSSDANGNLWQIGIDTHTAPTGKPKRITQWAGSYLGGLSVSGDGKRLILQKTTLQAQVYLGELASGGTRMNPPRRLTNDEAFDLPSAWTPDSKAVLFRSNRTGTRGIFKQGISEDTAEPVVTRPQEVYQPRLSPDGAWILYVEYPRTRANPAPPDRLMRIPVSGGVPQLVLETRDWLNFACARTPASLCMIVEASRDKTRFVITAFDPLKGRGKVLRTLDADPTVDYPNALSPDGATFAISRSGEAEIHIRLLSLFGGADREITVKGWPNIAGLDLSADGRGLYCGSASPQGCTLLYVDLEGTARVLWQYKGRGNAIWAVPSPDGRYLAIPGIGSNSNVWMVEGF